LNDDAYYDEVAAYYDVEADEFEARVCDNHVRQHMLDAFREMTLQQEPKRMLEIGYGPGVDMFWFAEQPGVEVIHGLDVTPAFHRLVLEKAETMGDGKVRAMLGSAEEASSKMGHEKVDTVFVYFGALNPTTDLDASAKAIASVLEPGGRAVLSFVNRWYLFDVLWNLVMLRPKAALARLRPVWGGYSPTRYLPSVCYSSRDVRKAFAPHLKRVRREGFCITHPAWYRHQWAPKGSFRNRLFLLADRVLKYTPLWNLGEYSLYVYERPTTD
jgi:SAM-dependent methyltransferase